MKRRTAFLALILEFEEDEFIAKLVRYRVSFLV
jgi:hypothetical protein